MKKSTKATKSEKTVKALVTGYVATNMRYGDKVISHLRTGGKGRPTQFLSINGEMVPLKEFYWMAEIMSNALKAGKTKKS